ncbi:MAG: small multi-drug export protein [Candidatus Magasanikbacteria bacterium]|nr:small multi-drug export protein [Candidatus Magasanikbacteria bacterium]
MTSAIVNFFSQFPPELATLLMAMMPVGELRLALPVAVLGFKLPLWEAFFWAVLGNLIPPLIILLFADRFHRYVETKSGWLLGKHWARALARAQAKFSGDYQKYGLIGLMIFIGIPLPLTGAWTGALAAFVFGIPFRKAWPYVLAGVLISGLITLLVTVGADKIF